jgi:hypothetical protein
MTETKVEASTVDQETTGQANVTKVTENDNLGLNC